MHNKTIDYYNKHTREFIDRTIEADMSFCQKKFIRLLEPGGLILDAGCGSGRDSKFFLGNGFRVQAMDASIKMCRAESYMHPLSTGMGRMSAPITKRSHG